MSTEAPPAPAPTPAQPVSSPAAEPTPAAITSNPPPATHVETPPAPAAPPVEAPPVEAPPVVVDNRAAPAADPTPPPPAITADGKLGENWYLTLGDEFAPHAKDLGKHKDIRSLVTELNYFRKNGVDYPGENAPQQAIDRFRKVAGVPETPEGYGLTAENLQLPAGMEFDQELADAVSKAAHKTHTPPAAVAAIVGEFNGLLQKRMADAAAAEKDTALASQDALVAEWRGDFQNNASTVRHMANVIGDMAGILPDDPGLASLMADINSKPVLSKMLLQVSKMLGEDRTRLPHGFGVFQSPADRIAEITSGKDPVWGERYRNGDVAAYDHVNQLREQARK